MSMQAALDGEYAIMYAYGVAGARLAAQRDVALTLLEEHRASRDQLRQWLLADGDQPGPPAPAYTLPTTVTADTAARDLLADLELRLIPLYTQLVADFADDQPRQRWAVRQIRACALRAQFWGAAGQAFPWPEELPTPV
ncbi:MAG: ferritin-like domain-containing protein [Candidatus Nanopelagicales bacterium]|jgi:hypothetical protein|nr:ferritin-like domain-containing protein [Candidatus Nanopelagicales bacterium]